MASAGVFHPSIFSGSAVQDPSNVVIPCLTGIRRVGTLWQELALRPVGILVRPTQPRWFESQNQMSTFRRRASWRWRAISLSRSKVMLVPSSQAAFHLPTEALQRCLSRISVHQTKNNKAVFAFIGSNVLVPAAELTSSLSNVERYL